MDSDELYEGILRGLEIDHQFVAHVEPDDEEQIELIRRLGRRAGRTLRWKVRTFRTASERREDRKVVVGIVVVDSTPEEEARMDERSDLIVQHMKLG